ncbi:MAG: hypothetical protein KGZ63_08865 [Clostridiales bacterium]|jgi:hypothetical protein|nr:hypothetical protein [Clostridiales bacterium]
MQLAGIQQVLLAIYSESQKINPNVCSSVTAKKLGMDPVKFKVAIDKLESKGLIYGSLIITGDCCPIPRMVLIDNVKLTQFGIECVEKIQQILRDIPYQAINGENKIRQPWLNQITAQVNEVCSIENRHKAC